MMNTGRGIVILFAGFFMTKVIFSLFMRIFTTDVPALTPPAGAD
jgi:hypothetical protein